MALLREKLKSVDQKVLLLPALIPINVVGNQVFFLFSLSQVEDVLKEADIRPVPFSPEYVEGLSRWRDNVVPVVSLEKCLGFDPHEMMADRRLMIVRTGLNTKTQKTRGMLRVIGNMSMSPVPNPCVPVSSVRWIRNASLVRGVYRWDQGYIIIAHLENILSGMPV